MHVGSHFVGMKLWILIGYHCLTNCLDKVNMKLLYFSYKSLIDKIIATLATSVDFVLKLSGHIYQLSLRLCYNLLTSTPK